MTKIKTKTRLYCLYGDTVNVVFNYDEESGKYFGDYPDFEDNPRFTPCGRRWVNSTKDDCTCTENKYGDCGSCKHYVCEKAGDLIGVCNNEQLRKEDTK